MDTEIVMTPREYLNSEAYYDGYEGYSKWYMMQDIRDYMNTFFKIKDLVEYSRCGDLQDSLHNMFEQEINGYLEHIEEWMFEEQ